MSSNIGESVRSANFNQQEFMTVLREIVDGDQEKVSAVMLRLETRGLVLQVGDQVSLGTKIINIIKVGIDQHWIINESVSLIHLIGLKHLTESGVKGDLDQIMASFEAESPKEDPKTLVSLFQEYECNEILSYFTSANASNPSFLSSFVTAVSLLPEDLRVSTSLALSYLFNPLNTESLRSELLVALRKVEKKDLAEFILLVSTHLLDIDNVNKRQSFITFLADMYEQAKAEGDPINKVTQYCAEHEGAVIPQAVQAQAPVAVAAAAAVARPTVPAAAAAAAPAAVARPATPAAAAATAAAAAAAAATAAAAAAAAATAAAAAVARPMAPVAAAAAAAAAPAVAYPAGPLSKEQIQELMKALSEDKKTLIAEFVQKNLAGIDENRGYNILGQILTSVPEACFMESVSLLTTIKAEPKRKIDLMEIVLDSLKKYKYEGSEMSEFYSTKLMNLQVLFSQNVNHEVAILNMQKWENLTEGQQNKASESMGLLFEQDVLWHALHLMAYAEPSKQAWSDYVDDLSAVTFATDLKHFNFWVEVFRQTTKEARAKILAAFQGFPKDCREILIDSVLETFQQMGGVNSGGTPDDRLNTLLTVMSGS